LEGSIVVDIREAELDAYVDGELDLARRLAVESLCAAHPPAAARVMDQLRAQTALRLLHAAPADDAVPLALTEAAERVERRIRGRSDSIWRRPLMARAVGVAAVVAVAWTVLATGTGALARAPDYVGDAYAAYQTALLRAHMASQPESTVVDAREVLNATRIPVPRFPAGWRITDLQVFPSDEGPALQIMIDAPGAGPVSIFAVRARGDAPTIPQAVRHGDASVAYWRRGEIAYALTGTGAPDVVDRIAEHFAAGANL
jgi:anti-sigma factor RsiW